MDFEDIAALGTKQRVFRARFKLDQPGFISHITQRAAGKELLFVEDDDYMTMLGLLKESCHKFNLSYYAFCLMPNHLHMLIEPKEQNLAEAMRSIFSRYAAKFNHKYQRKGHLFGGPYRQAVCLDSTYLLTASVYIHLNPVRAGVTQTANSYRWTSSLLYCHDQDRASFIDPHPILTLLDDDTSAACNLYSRILQQGQGSEPDNALEQEGAIERFCKVLSGLFPSLFRKVAEKKSTSMEPAEDILELTSLQTLLHEVQSETSKAPQSKEARRYLVQQLLARGFKKTQIADQLGISRGTVYNILRDS